MAQPGVVSPRPGGRPRDESRDRAIRRATLQLLAEFGYDGVTMDRVATRAKAGKATIYRRWPSKVALVMDAITSFTERTMQVPDTGSLRGDLIAYFTTFHSLISGDQGRILAELISEMPRNPELRDTLRRGLWTQRRVMWEAIIERARQRGEIAPGVDPAMLLELGTALILQRVLMTGEPVDQDFLARVVDTLALPYAQSSWRQPVPVGVDGQAAADGHGQRS